MTSTVKDTIGRPIQNDAVVFVKATSETGRVLGRTAGRKNLVDVMLGDGRIVAFYGDSLFLR